MGYRNEMLSDKKQADLHLVITQWLDENRDENSGDTYYQMVEELEEMGYTEEQVRNSCGFKS